MQTKQNETSRTSSPSLPRSHLGARLLPSGSENPRPWEEASDFPFCSGCTKSNFDKPPPPSPQKNKPWTKTGVVSLASISVTFDMSPLTSFMSPEGHAHLAPPWAVPVPQGMAAANAPWPGPGHISQWHPPTITSMPLPMFPASRACRFPLCLEEVSPFSQVQLQSHFLGEATGICLTRLAYK